MTKTTQKRGSLSIELLPEFGLLLNGQPVYGPGSVFQGIVHLSLPPKHNAHRLSLVFHASESVQLHSTMASVIRGRHHQLFGTQRILWEKSAQDMNHPPDDHYSFTLQMPMLQHPPSMDYHRLRYKCRYKLTVLLEQERRSTPLLTAHKTVCYRPWIPTRALKVPMIRHSKWLMIQMATSDLVAGESCPLSVVATCLDSPYLQVALELVQIVTLPYQMKDERVPPSETILARSDPLNLSSSQQQQQQLSIVIPADAPPTYRFGRTITIRYELALRTCWKKRNTKWTTWTSFGEEEDIRIPLEIGTLGHGIHLPEDMKHYTDFEGLFEHKNPSSVIATVVTTTTTTTTTGTDLSDSTTDLSHPSSTTTIMPVPKFLPSIEYEHSPPSYVPSTLPAYDPSTSTCITT